MKIAASLLTTLLVLVGTSLYGQATRPATPRQLEQALEEFRAGKFNECLATVAAFQVTLQPAGVKLTQSDWINSAHLEAIAQMSLGELDKASLTMDRVVASGKSNRSIV